MKNIKIELKRVEMPAPSVEHIQKNIDLCRAVYFARRHLRPMSTPQMILEQLRFIAKPIWALQALVMLVMCFVIHRTLLTQDALNIFRSLSLSSVFTAMTILNDPDVLILDEPTSGLDPGERVRFRNLLSELAQDRIVLISTHIVSDVEYIATRNAIMKGGKLIGVGTTDELLETVRDKVFSATIQQSELSHYEAQVRIVSIKGEDDGKISIRYIANAPCISGSVLTQPHLEDLYLWLFRQESARKEEAGC